QAARRRGAGAGRPRPGPGGRAPGRPAARARPLVESRPVRGLAVRHLADRLGVVVRPGRRAPVALPTPPPPRRAGPRLPPGPGPAAGQPAGAAPLPDRLAGPRADRPPGLGGGRTGPGLLPRPAARTARRKRSGLPARA